MYILFDSKGEEILRYFLEDLPEELKKHDHIEISGKDIPQQDGHITRAKLVNGELEWEFIKEEKPINAEEEIQQLKEENKILSEAITELANLMGGLM